MGLYDVNGNAIGTDLENVFEVKKIFIPSGEKVNFPGDGKYYCNPFGFSTNQYNIKFYDENDNYIDVKNIKNLTYRTDLHSLAGGQRDWIEIDGTTITIRTVINKDEFDAGSNHGIAIGEFESIPKYMRASKPMTYEVYSYSEFDANKVLTIYNDNVSEGLLEQVYKSSFDQMFNDLNKSNENGRKLRSNIIYIQNKMRHAMRLATFNIATVVREHWKVLKECLEDYGIDICGMQEVRYPLSVEPTLVDYFTGWAFPYVSDNGDAYRKGSDREGLNERNLLSRIPIDSTEEYELTMGTDYRYVAKSILSLPRYMDKRGSENLKMSIYNFQLEVSGTRAQENAVEVLEVVQNDDNPFIVLMGDTNDFSINKEVWKIFENAGFTPVVSTNSATASGTYDYNCIDNFFLSKRITPLDYDIISAQNYPWVSAGTVRSALSDHDLVIADVVLDYSDIRCVNYRLTDVTATAEKNRTWLSSDETLAITLTPASGYTLGAISVLDGDRDNTDAYTISDNTITLIGNQLKSDVLITCSGVSS